MLIFILFLRLISFEFRFFKVLKKLFHLFCLKKFSLLKNDMNLEEKEKVE